MSAASAAKKAAIVADRKAGMSIGRIAKKHGASETSVKRWYREALEAEGIFHEVGPRITYTDEQKRAVLADHYTSGRSVNASAKHHGISEKTLAAWIKRDDSWMTEADRGIDIEHGEWVLCPRRRIQVFRAA